MTFVQLLQGVRINNTKKICQETPVKTSHLTWLRCSYTIRFARAEPCDCPVHRPIVTCGVLVECSGPMKIGDTSLLQIDDFNLIPQGKICSAHAGLLIYLRKDIKYKVLHVCPKSTIWEGQFIQLTEKLANKKIVLGNIYRPPMDTNNNYRQFISEFATLLAHLDRCNSDVIIGGDFNIDLLKINDKPTVSEYLDMVISHGFFPKITLPTRLSERSGTLIDNFLCKLTHNFAHISAGILVCRISDHFPYFLRLDYGQIKRVLPPPYIRERPINDVNLQNFKS